MDKEKKGISHSTKRRSLNKEKQISGADYELIEQCLVIKLGKELDHHSSLVIREKSDWLIDCGTVKNIIFDFAGANFMDSSGIGVIMGRYKRVIYSGGKVAVTNVGEAIDRILKLSGLYKIIEKYSTVDDAMDSFKVS